MTTPTHLQPLLDRIQALDEYNRISSEVDRIREQFPQLLEHGELTIPLPSPRVTVTAGVDVRPDGWHVEIEMPWSWSGSLDRTEVLRPIGMPAPVASRKGRKSQWVDIALARLQARRENERTDARMAMRIVGISIPEQKAGDGTAWVKLVGETEWKPIGKARAEFAPKRQEAFDTRVWALAGEQP